jgi:hypothetical protein
LTLSCILQLAEPTIIPSSLPTTDSQPNSSPLDDVLAHKPIKQKHEAEPTSTIMIDDDDDDIHEYSPVQHSVEHIPVTPFGLDLDSDQDGDVKYKANTSPTSNKVSTSNGPRLANPIANHTPSSRTTITIRPRPVFASQSSNEDELFCLSDDSDVEEQQARETNIGMKLNEAATSTGGFGSQTQVIYPMLVPWFKCITRFLDSFLCFYFHH